MSSAFTRNPQLLNSACDLWILPPPMMSTWFPRIDWYLNWQLTRGLAHKMRRPSLELLRLMGEWGISYMEAPPLESAPLLAISEGRIPCAKCAVLDSVTNLAEWLGRAQRLVADLRAKTVRVFLPEGVSESQAKDKWSSLPPGDLEVDMQFLVNDVPSPDEGPSAW